IARYRPDGNIEILGRYDDQVKIRGFRIELGEVESVLMQHPQVQSVVAVIHESPNRSKQIVAYVVPKTLPIPSDDLRQFLETRLPQYMIPAAFVHLDSLPVTVVG